MTWILRPVASGLSPSVAALPGRPGSRTPDPPIWAAILVVAVAAPAAQDRAVMHSTRIGDSCRQPPGVRPGQTGSTGAAARAGLGVRVGGPRRSV